MRLKRGDVLVKLRGGTTKRMKVVELGGRGTGAWWVTLEALASWRNSGPSSRAHAVTLDLQDDGLPDGYVLEEP